MPRNISQKKNIIKRKKKSRIIHAVVKIFFFIKKLSLNIVTAKVVLVGIWIRTRSKNHETNVYFITKSS